MKFSKIVSEIKSLCTPALVYFVLSALAFAGMVFQNIGNTDRFCFGKHTCNVPSTIGMFIGQAFWIGLWTYILNYLCRKGHTELSWVLLFLPIIILFVFIGVVVAAVLGGSKSVEKALHLGK
jgi:hypothetical protein